MNTLQLFIICVTIIGGLSIICYTISYLLTNPTVIKAVKQTVREVATYDYPQAG